MFVLLGGEGQKILLSYFMDGRPHTNAPAGVGLALLQFTLRRTALPKSLVEPLIKIQGKREFVFSRLIN